MSLLTVDPALLKTTRFFSDFSDGQLGRIAPISSLVDYEPNVIIFREGDTTDFLLVLIAGSVALELCAPAMGCKRILTAGPGELLGWSSVLGQSALTATARAIEPVEAVKIQSRDLLAICGEDASLGYEIMRRTALTLAKRLRAARLQLTDVYTASNDSTKQSQSVQP